MGYLLDANVFMSAKRLHYGLDFCPAFWDWLIVMHRAAKVFSIEKVADEIAAIETTFRRGPRRWTTVSSLLRQSIRCRHWARLTIGFDSIRTRTALGTRPPH
jgi:hypothetical protein